MTGMRMVVALALGASVLAGCGKREERAQADAKAAGFVPPSVTARIDYGGASDRRFRTLDRNGDDALTHDELPRADSRLPRLDRNRDGSVSSIEWSEGMLARFDRMDINHDGTVTSEERQTSGGR